MNREKKLDICHGVVVKVKEVFPTLVKDDINYAHLIKAELESGITLEIMERRSLPISDYIGKNVECILEVLDVDFFYPKTKNEITELPSDVMQGTYLWSHTGYKFIPELFEMIEGHADEEDYDYDEEEYDRVAEGYFADWGVAGLGLEVYQDKPMVQTSEGVFLFNEFQNEKDIEEWNLGQTVFFRPKKNLLRGFKFVEIEGWRKNSSAEKEITAGPNEMIIRGGWSVLDPY